MKSEKYDPALAEMFARWLCAPPASKEETKLERKLRDALAGVEPEEQHRKCRAQIGALEALDKHYRQRIAELKAEARQARKEHDNRVRAAKAEQLQPRPCAGCGQQMFPEERNRCSWHKKKFCCYHCRENKPDKHGYWCSTVEGIFERAADENGQAEVVPGVRDQYEAELAKWLEL